VNQRNTLAVHSIGHPRQLLLAKGGRHFLEKTLSTTHNFTSNLEGCIVRESRSLISAGFSNLTSQGFDDWTE
jgi:hypothetical protein